MMNLLRALLALAVLTIGLLGTSSWVLADPLNIGTDIPYSILVYTPGEFSFAEAEQRLRNDPAEQKVTL